jgi:osmotically inducible lipoprotein OsmB
MKKIIIAAAASALALSIAACNTPGERAVGGAALGGLAGAAIGGVATGHTSGALAGAAVGAAGGAVVGAATTPEPEVVEQPVSPMRQSHTPVQTRPAPARTGVNPGSQGVNRGSQGVYRNQGMGTPNCRYGTYTLHGSVYCKP